MSEIEDEIVEAMARAMCIADNGAPDGVWTYDWQEHVPAARRQYRAWLAMQSILLRDHRASAQSPVEEKSDNVIKEQAQP